MSYGKGILYERQEAMKSKIAKRRAEKFLARQKRLPIKIKLPRVVKTSVHDLLKNKI
jgi:hypothetical protein